MALQEKQLGQLRPANTTAASVYSPGAGVTAVIKGIFIANTTGATVNFRLFVDDDGSTYDESTALYWDASVPANSTVEITAFIAMNDSGGNIAVRTDTASALTFTVFGAEIE